MSEENSSFLDNCLNAVDPAASFVGHTVAGVETIEESAHFVATVGAPAGAVMAEFPPSTVVVGPYLLHESIEKGQEIIGQYAATTEVVTEGARENLEFGCFVADVARENLEQTAADVAERVDRLEQFAESAGSSSIVNSLASFDWTHGMVNIDPVEEGGAGECGTGLSSSNDPTSPGSSFETNEQ